MYTDLYVELFSMNVRESPVEWSAFEGTFACEVEDTFQRISQSLPKFLIISTRRAHVLRDVSNAFRERTYKHESERKSYESSD